MTRVSAEEFSRIMRLKKERKTKRQEKRAVLWGTKVMSVTRTVLKAQIAGLWGIIVKTRDRILYGFKCRICRERNGTVAYHIVPKQRGDMARFDLENGCLACSPCNNAERLNRSLYQDVKHIDIFGKEMIDRLKERARMTADYSTADLLAIRDRFRDMIQKGEWNRRP